MLKKGLKMHHMVQKTPWPSGKAKVCNTSIPGPIPGGASKKNQSDGLVFLFGRATHEADRTRRFKQNRAHFSSPFHLTTSGIAM